MNHIHPTRQKPMQQNWKTEMKHQTPSQQQPPFEPPKEVIDLLNAADSGYIGFQRPRIKHIKEESLSYERENEAKLDAGDYSPLDNGF